MRVLITGITGSLGSGIAGHHHSNGDVVYGCARNESVVASKQTTSPWGAGVFCHDAMNLEGLLDHIGTRIDRVYHCAATKHIENCELFPVEAVRQNIAVVEHVSLICRRRGIDLVFISSDKACIPGSAYGATKLMGEKLALSMGGRAIRLGNLIGSSGSVFQKWAEAHGRIGRISVTDPEMTRFFVKIADAVQLIASDDWSGLVTPKMLSIRIGDAASVFGKYEVIGKRPGERMHEWSVAPGEKVEASEIFYKMGCGETVMDGISSENSGRWDLSEFETALIGCGCHPVCNREFLA